MINELRERLGLAKGPLMSSQINEMAGRVMNLLPPCTGNVVIACPYYDNDYRCEVIVPAQALLTFMNRVSGKIAIDCKETGVWLDVSVRWLNVAHCENDGKSYVPSGMAKLFKPLIPEMIAERIAAMYCAKCGSQIQTWDEHKSNDSFSLVHAVWDETLHCKCGQLLYSHHQDFVFYAS